MRRSKPLIGTWVDITVDASSDENAIEATNEAFEEIRRIESVFSRFDPMSEVSRINQMDQDLPINLSNEMADLLRFSQKLNKESSGMFNPVIDGSIQNIQWLLPTTIKLKGEIKIDFGGVAKGYAVDRAIEVLTKSSGIQSGLVNAGGDLRGFGLNKWNIHVRDSEWQCSELGFLQISNEALATSVRKSIYSISVLASTCMIADALTKVVVPEAVDSENILELYGAKAWIKKGYAGSR